MATRAQAIAEAEKGKPRSVAAPGGDTKKNAFDKKAGRVSSKAGRVGADSKSAMDFFLSTNLSTRRNKDIFGNGPDTHGKTDGQKAQDTQHTQRNGQNTRTPHADHKDTTNTTTYSIRNNGCC